MGAGALLLLPFLWTSPKDHENDLEKAENAEESLDDDHGDDEEEAEEHNSENEEADYANDSHEISNETGPNDTDTKNDAPRLSWFSRTKAFLFGSSDEDEDDGFIPNYRLLPIFSGVVIPFSILLEIPGLTDKWYIRTEGYKIVETRSNTVILDVGLGLSMLCAVIANVCVVLRFLEKSEVKKVTILAVVALTVHDVINITAIIVFGLEHQADDGFTYGPSYWITVCSTVASTATNLTLMWDLWKTPNFAKSGSGLTRKQRSLVIIVIVLLCYIAFGALINSFLIHLDFIDALYYTIVSIETVGFGDIVPLSTGARIFTCAYVAFGIVNLGVAVGMCRETVFEQLEVSYRKRMSSVRQARAEHRRWRAWERSWKKAVEWRLKEMEVEEWVPDKESDTFSPKNVEYPGRDKTPGALIGRILGLGFGGHSAFRHHGQVRGVVYGHPGTHLNIEALSPAQLEAAAAEAGVPLDAFCNLRQTHDLRTTSSIGDGSIASPNAMLQFFRRPNAVPLENEPISPIKEEMEKMSGMLTKFALASTGIAIGANKTPHVYRAGSSGSIEPPKFQKPAITQTQSARSRGELRTEIKSMEMPNFKQSMQSEETKAFWAKLVVAWSLFLIFWMAGAGIFSSTESWSFGVAMYFCFMTFTTTGYGDYSPVTPAGRSIFVLWALLGLGTMTILVSVLQEAFSSRYKNAFYSGAFHKAVKKYRQRRKNRDALSAPPTPAPHPQTKNVDATAIQQANERAQKHLEELPGHILRQCRSFYRHVQYFMHIGNGNGTQYQEGKGSAEMSMPVDLRVILDEIARSQNLGDRVKNEIMQDEDSRNTLFMLSFEKALREMIDVAERSLSALVERDRLEARYQHEKGGDSNSKTPDEDISVEPRLETFTDKKDQPS